MEKIDRPAEILRHCVLRKTGKRWREREREREEAKRAPEQVYKFGEFKFIELLMNLKLIH